MAQTQALGFQPITAALLGPDILARQLRLQQDAQYGQQMLQEGQQVPQGQMVSGHYVAPSFTQYLANALKTGVGRSALNQIPQEASALGRAQMQGINRMFGVPTQPTASPGAQAFPVGPSGTPQQPPIQPQQPSVAPQQSGMASPMGAPRMPLLPGRTPAQSAQAYALLGPQAYMTLVANQGAPTDMQKNLIAMGIQPGSPQWNQTMAGIVNKSTYIAPINVRPGGSVYDPVKGQVDYHAPGTNGTQIVETPNGPAMVNIPGSTQAVQAASTAKAAGPAAYKNQIINNPDGTNTLTTALAIGNQVNGQLPAPVRNNNPGALMPGGKLATYGSMEEGIKALDANLARYGQQGINTIAGAISKWAPPNENDTQAYIKDVANRLGISPTQKINLSNPLVRQAIGTAIAIHENGVKGVFGDGAAPQSSSSVPGIPVQGEGTIAANQELGKDQAKTLVASRDAAINATNELTNIAAERKAIATGTYGGTGAQAKLNAAKFAQGWLGIKLDPTKVTNTDYLSSMLGNGMLANIKKLGSQPTDADRNTLESIVGNIGKDPQALNKLIDFQEMMANRVIQRHNQLVAQATKGGIQSAFDMLVSPKTGMPGTEPSTSGFKIIGVR